VGEVLADAGEGREVQAHIPPLAASEPHAALHLVHDVAPIVSHQNRPDFLGGVEAFVFGPSIRLAEAMAQSWGNMQFGIRELEQSDNESTVQAYAWDVETNTRREITFQVPHVRYTRAGSKKLEDPRDVYEMVANQGSRRLRACILAVIPGDVTEAAVKQCEMTMKATADTSPEAILKILSAFEPFGVSKEMIEKRIQRRMDAIQPAQVVSLKKIYASLRDGMSGPGDWFEGAEFQTSDKPRISQEQLETLIAAISAAGKAPAEVCKKLRIGLLHDLEADRFDVAVNTIKAMGPQP